MKLAIAITTICLATSSLADFFIKDVKMQSFKGTELKEQENFFDYSEGVTSNKMVIQWNNPDPLNTAEADILSKMEISLKEETIISYDALGPETIYGGVLNETNALFEVDKTNQTATLEFKKALLELPYTTFEGIYTIRIKSFEDQSNSSTFDVMAIKYCEDPDTTIHVEIDEEACKATVTNAGCDDFILHEPTAKLRFVDADGDGSEGPGVDFEKTEPQEDGTFKYKPVSNVLDINDNTPSNPKLEYSFQHGADDAKTQSANFNKFVAKGCPDFTAYCASPSSAVKPPFPFPENFDWSLSCSMTNHTKEASTCRSGSIVPAKDTEEAVLTFSCTGACTFDSWVGEGETPTTATTKVLTCAADSKQWVDNSENSKFWPKCACTNGAMTVSTMSLGLAMIMAYVLKVVS